jgi:hypothetical protein
MAPHQRPAVGAVRSAFEEQQRFDVGEATEDRAGKGLERFAVGVRTAREHSLQRRHRGCDLRHVLVGGGEQRAALRCELTLALAVGAREDQGAAHDGQQSAKRSNEHRLTRPTLARGNRADGERHRSRTIASALRGAPPGG